MLHLSHERGHDAGDVLVHNLGEEYVAGPALDQGCAIAVPGACDQVAFPVAGDGAVLHSSGPFPD